VVDTSHCMCSVSQVPRDSGACWSSRTTCQAHLLRIPVVLVSTLSFAAAGTRLSSPCLTTQGVAAQLVNLPYPLGYAEAGRAIQVQLLANVSWPGWHLTVTSPTGLGNNVATAAAASNVSEGLVQLTAWTWNISGSMLTQVRQGAPCLPAPVPPCPAAALRPLLTETEYHDGA
jgi:hypothetical protein